MGQVGRLGVKGVGKCSGGRGGGDPRRMKFQKCCSLVGAMQLELYNAHIYIYMHTYVDLCIYL